MKKSWIKQYQLSAQKRVYIEDFFKYLGFCWSVSTTLLISEIRVQKVTAPFSCNTWAADCYLLKRRSCMALYWIGYVGVVSCKTIPETLPAKELVLRSLRSEQLLLIEDLLLKI
jgi:hypothetical protein